MHDTVRQNNVDSRSETLNDLDLEDGTLEFGQVHQSLAHTLLGQLDQEHDHVRDTLSGDGRGRHQRDVSTKVLVLVVQNSVETLFSESQLGGLKTVLKLSLSVLALLAIGLSESAVGNGLPVVTPVDLVERDNERSLPFTEETDRFECLRFETVLREHLPLELVHNEGSIFVLTVMSTTKMAMLHSELPRVRKLVNDS